MLARLSAPVAAAASDAAEAVSAVAASAIALVTPAKNWTQIKEKTDARIADLQTRRAGLYLERRDAVVDEIGGDTAAGQRAGKIDAHIADIDRELSRLHDVRADTVDRIATEAAAQAAQAEQARLDGVAAIVTKASGPLADAVDKATTDLTAALRAYCEAVTSMRVAADRQEVHELAGDMVFAAQTLLKHRIGVDGFAGLSALQPDTLANAITKTRPPADYVVNLAREPRR